MKDSEWFQLEGRTIIECVIDKTGESYVAFACQDGTTWILRHFTECCEEVKLAAVEGDTVDIIGSPILKATTDRGQGEPSWLQKIFDEQLVTSWETFTITTAKGSVTFKVTGWSNGYYSETMGFYQLGVEE